MHYFHKVSKYKMIGLHTAFGVSIVHNYQSSLTFNNRKVGTLKFIKIDSYLNCS